MAVEYRFLTTWLLESPREPVWEAVFDQKSWPSWWRGVEDVVELDPGDEHGVGSHSRLTWRSKLPYDLVFEAKTRTVERPVPLSSPKASASISRGFSTIRVRASNTRS